MAVSVFSLRWERGEVQRLVVHWNSSHWSACTLILSFLFYLFLSTWTGALGPIYFPILENINK